MNEEREQRISVSDDEIVIFYQTVDGFFHGHVRTWIDIKTSGKIGWKYIDTLKKNGLLEVAKQHQRTNRDVDSE